MESLLMLTWVIMLIAPFAVIFGFITLIVSSFLRADDNKRKWRNVGAAVILFGLVSILIAAGGCFAILMLN